MKLHAMGHSEDIWNFIKQNYGIISEERKIRLHQLLLDKFVEQADEGKDNVFQFLNSLDIPSILDKMD